MVPQSSHRLDLVLTVGLYEIVAVEPTKWETAHTSKGPKLGEFGEVPKNKDAQIRKSTIAESLREWVKAAEASEK